ncbi:hypothetical protein C2G38_2308534 [Gigaspora rosea]|uniref:Uncharacterized protein n=1 Tax=Gigaspora rosea TaxID=44941 RepID=A0A397V927_9GLOM|nr:hypothetical protein C2G38_2308534 [Gigaspora rosea]
MPFFPFVFGIAQSNFCIMTYVENLPCFGCFLIHHWFSSFVTTRGSRPCVIQVSVVCIELAERVFHCFVDDFPDACGVIVTVLCYSAFFWCLGYVIFSLVNDVFEVFPDAVGTIHYKELMVGLNGVPVYGLGASRIFVPIICLVITWVKSRVGGMGSGACPRGMPWGHAPIM